MFFLLLSNHCGLTMFIEKNIEIIIIQAGIWIILSNKKIQILCKFILQGIFYLFINSVGGIVDAGET